MTYKHKIVVDKVPLSIDSVTSVGLIGRLHNMLKEIDRVLPAASKEWNLEIEGDDAVIYTNNDEIATWVTLKWGG